MEEKEPIRFEMISKDGKPIECTVLFTFRSDEYDKYYIVYTDNSIGNDGGVRISASQYFPENFEHGATLTAFMPIESDEEWEYLDAVINQVLGDSDGN